MDSQIQKLSNEEIINEIKKFVSDIEKFKSCITDEDRVKITLNDMDGSFCAIGECSYGKKSLEESEKFRHSGNHLFKSTSSNLEEVLKLYSQSILYAPPGSEQLSLAYANRSAVLFRGKYYEECLEDISRALETGYPNSLKPKLLIRRVTCNYALTGNVDFATEEGLIEARALIDKLPVTSKMRKMIGGILNDPEKITSVERQVRKTWPKYQPEMKGRNPHLPGASDAIALKYSQEYGRHLVATRNINSGEVLLIERPYTTVIADEWIHCICSLCTRRTWSGIPCDDCTHAMYCSTECKQAAWEEYHDVECKVLGFAKKMGMWDHMLMGLKMTVKAIKEAGNLGALKERLKQLDSVEASDVEIPIDPNSYETFYIMSDSSEGIELSNLVVSSSMASILAYLLAVRTDIVGKKLTGNLRAVKDSEQLRYVANLTLKNIRIARNRTFGWKEDTNNIEDRQTFTLIPLFSFANNRCYDAARLLRFDKEVILVTPVPIKKGDQVFTHYLMNYKHELRDLRKQHFKDQWHFVCNCLACTENWSDSTSTQWRDQDLPPRVMEDLYNETRKFKWPHPEELRDPMKRISIKEKFCKLMDFIYPRVKKPCLEVEILVATISELYVELGSTVYPRFVGGL